MRAMEKQFIAPVYKALRKQTSSFTKLAKTYGLDRARSYLSSQVMDDEMAKVIQNIYLKAGIYTAKKTRIAERGVKNFYPDLQVKRTMGFNERMTTDILEYFRLYLLEKAILPISATTRERIETVLRKGIEEGWGVDEIVRKLESDVFRDMTRRRAEMIVRTETVRASNYGAMAAIHDSEFEYEKVWIAVNDARTRRTHRHFLSVEGEPRDLLVPFSNGLMFPGDPNGAPEETINCRCALAFEAKRDAAGRLIPKKKPAIVRNLFVDAIRVVYRRVAAFLNL